MLGRGRGLTTTTPIPTLGRGRSRIMFAPDSSTPKPCFEQSLIDDVSVNVPDRTGAPPHSLEKESSTEKLVSSIATQIGLSIGESIASSIESRLGNGFGPSTSQNSGNVVMDPSMLNVVVRADIKEPMTFKGDGHDAHTVQEWEALMVAYMRRRGIPVAEQAEEVLSRLVGRAREVVKVGIRSKPSLSLSGGPDPVFEILKQHFSDTVSSGMPLADFYATLPSPGEHPFDYWLRLNRAMERTEDCLKRQNKLCDSLKHDLTSMFVRHCPDPELSLIFKCKPLQQWTVAELHDRLVEHSRDQRQSPQLTVMTTMTCLRQDVDSSRKVSSTGPKESAAAAPSSGQQTGASADRLDELISRLERVLEQQTHQSRLFGRGVPRTTSQGSRVKHSTPCDVCGEVAHSTQHHCRTDRLCFVCYAPDHTRVMCPNAGSAKNRGSGAAPQPEGN